MSIADIKPLGFLLPNGCRITHGIGSTVKTPFSTIPLTMHELYPGGALDVPSTSRGQFGFIPFNHELRLPRHVHVTMADRDEDRRLLAERILVTGGVGLVELNGDIYVIPPGALVDIPDGVPHTWSACPPRGHAAGRHAVERHIPDGLRLRRTDQLLPHPGHRHLAFHGRLRPLRWRTRKNLLPDAHRRPGPDRCRLRLEHRAEVGTMSVQGCYNFHDFRRLAKRRLPKPIFDYIDGGADDEATYRRNTGAFEACDLVPNVLRGVKDVDMSVTIMGQKLAMPVYCSPTALQRLFHHDGERAVAAAAAKFGTMFGVSSLGTVSLEEARQISNGPQVYQFYFHKDRGLNRDMMARAKTAGIEVMMLTVDSITGGNRERDKRTGFSIPFRLTLPGLMHFGLKPAWGINYVTHEKFKLPQLDNHVDMGGGRAVD